MKRINFVGLPVVIKDFLVYLDVIKNKSTLDAALVQAEKIHSEITNILNNEKQKCYIGISTRTIRMITGERLLTEATEALRHAEEDEKNPIIAFRANAEKYMKMMQNQ